jgi:hypothetical protein
MTTTPILATRPFQDAAEAAAADALKDPNVSDKQKARLRGLLLTNRRLRLSALLNLLQQLKGSPNV